MRRHFDEVKVRVPGDLQRLRKGLDPELLAIGIDQSDLPSADPFVDPVLVSAGGGGYSASLLEVKGNTKRRASRSNARPDGGHSTRAHDAP